MRWSANRAILVVAIILCGIAGLLAKSGLQSHSAQTNGQRTEPLLVATGAFAFPDDFADAVLTHADTGNGPRSKATQYRRLSASNCTERVVGSGEKTARSYGGAPDRGIKSTLT